MKYTVKGTFVNGERWEDTAANKRELAFVLNQIYSNKSCNPDTIIITNKKGERVK